MKKKFKSKAELLAAGFYEDSEGTLRSNGHTITIPEDMLEELENKIIELDDDGDRFVTKSTISTAFDRWYVTLDMVKNAKEPRPLPG